MKDGGSSKLALTRYLQLKRDYKDISYILFSSTFRFNKYYVICFAINYTRFEVFSKDCDKKLIKWRDDDQNDPIKGIIRDDNYNENPVISMLRNFQ